MFSAPVWVAVHVYVFQVERPCQEHDKLSLFFFFLFLCHVLVSWPKGVPAWLYFSQQVAHTPRCTNKLIAPPARPFLRTCFSFHFRLDKLEKKSRNKIGFCTCRRKVITIRKVPSMVHKVCAIKLQELWGQEGLLIIYRYRASTQAPDSRQLKVLCWLLCSASQVAGQPYHWWGAALINFNTRGTNNATTIWMKLPLYRSTHTHTHIHSVAYSP